MIILDVEEKESFKQIHDPFLGRPTLRFPEKAASRSDSPLPDYETSEARQKLIAKELSAKYNRIEPRLWRAILYALLIYVLLTIVIGVPIIVVKTRQKAHSVPSNYEGPEDNGSSVNLNSSWLFTQSPNCQLHRIEVTGILIGATTPSAEHNFTYSGSYYIQSNISDATSNMTDPHLIGNLTVDLNPDPFVTEVNLKVDVWASSNDLLHNTATCFIDSEDKRGFLISMIRPLQGEDLVTVNIRMLLPQNASSTVLDNFVTNLPWFSHTFGDLKNYTMNNIVLSGTRFNVTAGVCFYIFATVIQVSSERQSLKGSTISVKNSYASIIGDFYATSSLTLDGIKGNIHANITLEQLNSSKNPTSLFLDTGDGSIDANVTLVAPSKARSHSPPFSFVADVQTFNGPVTFHADYTNSTPPTPLQLTVTNTDGNTNVSLGKKFEGNFSVQSKLGDVIVPKPPFISPALDPLGKHRQYTYQLLPESNNHSQVGWVGWGPPPLKFDDDDSSQGQVKVTTSLSLITLHLATP
ncbi:hypothetical protein C0989_010535 [Termitomyces sp. Mn162]|nr:hypothetical protein C0989_010535 [Termitomyces sp. Mn162]